jgi:hypothetical protein
MYGSASYAGAAAGLQSGAYNLVQARWLPDLTCKIIFQGNSGIHRAYVGLFAENPQMYDLYTVWETNGILASATKYVGFVYDYTIQSQNKWHCATYDNTSGQPNHYTNSNVDAVSSSARQLRIQFLSTSSVRFWIDDVAIATHSISPGQHKIPDQYTRFGLCCMAVHKTGESSAALMYIQRIVLEYGS